MAISRCTRNRFMRAFVKASNEDKQRVIRLNCPALIKLRAAWIGNDFSHYERRLSDLDLSDLKRFINATIAWIELELTTAEALAIPPVR